MSEQEQATPGEGDVSPQDAEPTSAAEVSETAEAAHSGDSDVLTEPAGIDEVVEASVADTAAINAAVARAGEPPITDEPPTSSVSTPEVTVAAAEAEAQADASSEAAAAAWATQAVPTEAAGAAVAADVPGAPAPQTVYVQAPIPPKARSNRWFATVVALIGAGVFAALYALGTYIYLSATSNARAFDSFLESPVFWGPTLALFVGYTVLGIIINRGPWWAHAVLGVLVGVFVYFSYLGFALIAVHAWSMTLAQAQEFVRQQWLSPYAIMSAVIAREIPVWFGGWIARNGRKVTARNEEAMLEYEREVAASPVFS